MDQMPPHPPRTSLRDRLRGLLIDTSPLRASRDYRLLYIGHSISMLGSHVTFVAVAFQVFDLTNSSLAVGLIGLCELIPLLTLSIVGGAVADSVDRRKLLLITDSIAAVTSAVLAVNAVADRPRLWVLYALVTVTAALYALGSPALRSTTPLLLPPDKLTAAAALQSVYFSVTSMAGPAIGGLLIGVVGLPMTYTFDAATYLASLVAIFFVRPIPPVEGTEKVSLQSIKQGLAFLRGKPVLLGSFTVDLNAMIFGMPMALFPAVAARLGGGPELLGLLYAAPSAGALVASLFSGWTNRIRRHGMAVYYAVIAWGGSLVAFGFVRSVGLALAALACAGAADEVSALFRTAILQMSTSEQMLGRLSGIELTVVASGPSLGDLEAGALAAFTSVPFSIVFGGLACILGVGAQALLLPQFARYDARTPKPDP